MAALAGVAISLGCAPTGPAARAADDVTTKKKQVDRQIVQLNDALEGTTTALANAFLNLRKTEAQLPGAQAAVTSAQAGVATAQAALADARTRESAAIAYRDQVAQRLALAIAQEARAAGQQKRDAASQVSVQQQLDAYAADVFQSGTESQLAVVFGATSPDDFAQRMIVAESVSAAADATLDDLRTAQADGAATSAYLSAVRQEIADLKVKADQASQAAAAATQAAGVASAQAVTAQANAVSAQDALVSLQTSQRSYAASVAAQKAAEEKQLEIARAESARLKAILVERARQAAIAEAKRRAAERERLRQLEIARKKAIADAIAKAKRDKKPVVMPPPVTLPSTNQSGGFVLSPPPYGHITSGFGMRFHPVLQRWMLHDGLDYGMPCGTPVYAAAAGTIFHAGFSSRGWGNQIMVDHGIHRGVDLVTTYNHLSRILRSSGPVARGDLIAYSGTTGYSTGCHLHFGVYENGTAVNPYTWF